MIVGFICCTRGRCSFEECLEAASHHPPQCPLTYSILAAMAKDVRQELRDIRVTSLLTCLRKVVLQRRQDIFVRPQDLYFTFRGQLFHGLIAAHPTPGSIVETRFSRDIAGLTISGQPDVIFPEQKKIVDYKSTRSVPKANTPYEHHAMQVNIYRWLVMPVYPVEELEIVYLDMDGLKRMRVPLMDLRRVTAFVAARAKVLKRGFDGGTLPARVGPEGLWQCRSFCPFKTFCWPKGVPTQQELRAQQSAKVRAIQRALTNRKESAP